MTKNAPSPILLDTSIIVSDADLDVLPLRRFNIVVLVEPDTEWYEPTPSVFSSATMIWEDVTEELLNFADDRQDVATVDEDYTSEIDIILARIGSGHWEIFQGAKDQAYVTFPQGIIQPYYDVLKHLGYWLTGLHQAHPHWKAVVIGATQEDDVVRVANVAAGAGIPTTILKRYCIPTQFFARKPEHDERPNFSYGEMTADKLSGQEL